jgi:hypothetical protein
MVAGFSVRTSNNGKDYRGMLWRAFGFMVALSYAYSPLRSNFLPLIAHEALSGNNF